MYICLFVKLLNVYVIVCRYFYFFVGGRVGSDYCFVCVFSGELFYKCYVFINVVRCKGIVMYDFFIFGLYENWYVYCFF